MNPSILLDVITTESLKQSIGLLINTWLKPSLENFLKNRKRRRDIDESVFFNTFQDYLEKAADNSRFMNTIVFNDERIEIENIYIPLTLSNKDLELEELIDSYNENFFNTYKRILIKDSAGMGKSTLMKWLFLAVIKKNSGIPIIIELRRLNDKNSILDEIINNLNAINHEFDKQFVLDLIDIGDFIFFFDGYDEVTFENVEFVTRDIQNFVDKANKNVFVLSSRPSDALNSFGKFQRFSIKPLNNSEAFELLHKYDVKNKYVDKLISKINEGNNLMQLEDFLGNPLMVSLLYKGFEYKETIPFKKHLFYRNVYDALFEHHDLSKGDSFIRKKKTQLDSDEFHRVLRKLAFESLRRNTIEFDKDELLQLIENAKKDTTEKKFNSSDFLNDCHNAVPLFTNSGNYYKWQHKSIMEYFAAKYIEIDSKEYQGRILEALYKSDRSYHNLFDLYYDIDYPSFEKYILFEISREYIQYYDEEINKYSSYPKTVDFDICKRISVLFNIAEVSFYKTDLIVDEVRNMEEGKFTMLVVLEGIGVMMKTRNRSIYRIFQLLIDKKSDNLVATMNPSYEPIKQVTNEESKKLVIDHNVENRLNTRECFNLVTEIMIEQFHMINHERMLEIIKKYSSSAIEIEDFLNGL